MARKPEDAPAKQPTKSGRTEKSGDQALRDGHKAKGSKTSAHVITATHQRRRRAMKELADR